MIPSQLSVLLEAALRALVAALAVWAGLHILRVKNVLVQKAAWGLVLIAALAMPLLMRRQWLPAWTAVKLPSASWTTMMDVTPPSRPASAVSISTADQPETMAQAVPESQDDFPAPAAAADKIDAPPIAEPAAVPVPMSASPQPASKPTAANDLGRWLAMGWIVYLGVCAALLLRLFWGLASSLRLWIEAEPVTILPKLEISESVGVRWSSQIASPVNIGSGILLPPDHAEWDAEKLRVVLAHERAHIRQHDFYLQILAGIYVSLTWFSPLGWWLKRKLSELGEAISDRAGLDAASSPSAYAGLLLEFAALPRPVRTGVAMAHSKNLSDRIERLLNDSTFRLAYAGGRRALLTLLVPALLIAGAAVIRVQAAATPQQADTSLAAKLAQDQAATQTTAGGQSTGQATGQANHEPAQVNDAGSSEAPQAAPAPEAAPAPPMPPAQAAPNPNPAPEAMPASPAPQAPAPGEQVPMPPMPAVPAVPPIHVQVHIPPMPKMHGMYADEGHRSCFENGDSYAIVGDPESKTQFCGDWGPERGAEVDKARSAAHGHFLLFRHDGKSYVIDDPATVSQIEAMDKQTQDLGDQMRELGKQMRDAAQPFREQMRDQQRQERDAERKARETASEIPTPDISKEMADLNAAVATLQAKQGGTITREQLNEIQRKIGEVQRRVIEAEVRTKVNVDFDMSKFNQAQSKFSEQESQFGAQMGKLGSQMGQAARENSQKIRSIMDESLQDGKARPVQ